jgi:hypothetical protein
LSTQARELTNADSSAAVHVLYIHVRAFYLSEHSFCEHPARGHKRNCSRLKACHCAPALGRRSSLFSSRSRATSWRRRESSRRSPPLSPSSPPSLPVLKIGGNESAGHQPACVGPTETPRIRIRQPCWARRTVGALLCRGSLRNTSIKTCHQGVNRLKHYCVNILMW